MLLLWPAAPRACAGWRRSSSPLVATIGACFLIEILSRPSSAILAALIPRGETALQLFARSDGGSRCSGSPAGRSSSRSASWAPRSCRTTCTCTARWCRSARIGATRRGKAPACRYNLIDSAIALNGAFFVNAAILVLAAAVFHRNGPQDVAQHRGGAQAAAAAPRHRAGPDPVRDRAAVLRAGRAPSPGRWPVRSSWRASSHLRIAPWLRRLITAAARPDPRRRGHRPERASGRRTSARPLSQVILSLQLSFAVIPLIHFTATARTWASSPTRRG